MELILPDQLVLRPDPSGSMLRIEDPQGTPLLRIAGPCFEVDGQPLEGFTWLGAAECTLLDHGGAEFSLAYRAPARPDLTLQVYLRTFPGSPFLRWRYHLSAAAPAALTKSGGQDRLRYFSLAAAEKPGALSEVQLSQFEPVLHSYLPGLETRPLETIATEESLPGPILALPLGQHCLLAAYEHDADHPDPFLAFGPTSG